MIQEDDTPSAPAADPAVPLRYARILRAFANAGLAVLFVTYALYVSGALAPYVAADTLTSLWHLPADQYREAAAIGTGWSWAGKLGYGDFLCILGVAVLASASTVGHIRLLSAFTGNRDRIYAVLALLQILVLLLAASGILAGR